MLSGGWIKVKGKRGSDKNLFPLLLKEPIHESELLHLLLRPRFGINVLTFQSQPI